ncbi:hypothetical protein [Streptomyces sp. NPDC057686]|uniref:hypothetical protein n=1 Tax=Streptomyces sp. NPDC057686 TaxID=3346212 RepID=UPI0036B26C5E
MTTNRETHEYLTFAPAGQMCAGCGKRIGALEPVRRGMLAPETGTPVVVYRHVTCRRMAASASPS